MKKFWIINKIDNSTAEILLYGYIDSYDVNAGDFVKELRELEKTYNTINVKINSGGGSVFDGLAIYNAMKQSSVIIDTYVDGLAGSMASIIAQGGKKRFISKYGQVMTHQPSMGSWGNSDEMKKNAELLKGLEQTMCAIYSSRTGKTVEECKTSFMNGKDNWFDAEKAITEGLADEIYDAEAVTIPAAAKEEKEIWNHYHTQRFAAKFIPQNTNPNMKQVFFPAASLAALGLTDAAEQSAIEAKISDMVAKAAKVDAAEAAKKKAEDDLAALQVQTVKKEVEQILSTAIAEKKITVEMKNVLAIQYAEKPVELQALVATFKPFESITKSTITDADKIEIEALMKLTGQQLFEQEGKFERLKEIYPDGYLVKYKEYFGGEPPADKK